MTSTNLTPRRPGLRPAGGRGAAGLHFPSPRGLVAGSRGLDRGRGETSSGVTSTQGMTPSDRRHQSARQPPCIGQPGRPVARLPQVDGNGRETLAGRYTTMQKRERRDDLRRIRTYLLALRRRWLYENQVWVLCLSTAYFCL